MLRMRMWVHMLVHSSLRGKIQARLSRLFVVDKEGRFWHGTNVTKGVKKSLQQSSKLEFRKWLAERKKRVGGGVEALLNGLSPSSVTQREWFYGVSSDNEMPIETTKAVTWHYDETLFLGGCWVVPEVMP